MPKAAKATTVAAMAKRPVSWSGAASEDSSEAAAAVFNAGAGAAAALAEAIFTVACGAGLPEGATSTLEVPFLASEALTAEGAEGGLSAEGPATAIFGAAGFGAEDDEAEAGFGAPGADGALGAVAPAGAGGFGAEGIAGFGAPGADGGFTPDGGAGFGAIVADGSVPDGFGAGAEDAPAAGFGAIGAGGFGRTPAPGGGGGTEPPLAFGGRGMPGGRGGGGGAPPGAGARGGAGIVGGAPAIVGRGLGGRLIMAASRGLAAAGLPSVRGGRTMRTVSFLGSFMAGDDSARRRVPRSGCPALTPARTVSILSP